MRLRASLLTTFVFVAVSLPAFARRSGASARRLRSPKIEPNSTGGAKLTVTVKRSGVRDDFLLAVPIRVEFDGNKAGTFFMPVRKNEETMSQEFPLVPRKIVFAPDHSLIANIRRE